MSMLMLAFFGQKKVYVPTTYTKTFTANATFTMPAGASMLDSIVGHGAAGQPGVPGATQKYTHVIHSYYRRSGGIDYVEGDQDGWVGNNSATGSDYCDPAIDYPDPSQGGSTVYWREVVCYYYKTRTAGGSDATTGASATGFGKVFPGGSGGLATTVTYTNVAVTALASYPVVVPNGASITITYKV